MTSVCVHDYSTPCEIIQFIVSTVIYALSSKLYTHAYQCMYMYAIVWSPDIVLCVL